MTSGTAHLENPDGWRPMSLAGEPSVNNIWSSSVPVGQLGVGHSTAIVTHNSWLQNASGPHNTLDGGVF